MAPSGQGQQQQRKAGEHGTQSQHRPQGKHHEGRQHLHNPTGYTDEVAEEEREFMMQAERSAGQGQGTTDTSSWSSGQNTKSSKKGGLESSMGSGGSQGGMGQKAKETMENIKNKAKDTMNLK